MRRLLLLAAAGLLATAATPPRIPSPLLPYVKGEHFDPGDYRWMRGRLPDATPEQRSTWRAILDWRNRCVADQVAAMRAELAQRGIAAPPAERSNGDGLCGEVGYALPDAGAIGTWATFELALRQARPVAQAIAWSAALAQSAAEPDDPTLAAQLIARPMTDQVLRGAVSWNEGEVKGAPPLDPASLAVADAMIWQAIARRDHDNTAWLKGVVARGGWPTVSAVGERASSQAWLLVQHADDDPVFQLDMLKLMEPLVARGEVAKKNYAYLYDWVMLKLAGKQRYGTQFGCVGGHWAPDRLEDGATVDASRKAMGMETLADNLARIAKTYGNACG